MAPAVLARKIDLQILEPWVRHIFSQKNHLWLKYFRLSTLESYAPVMAPLAMTKLAIMAIWIPILQMVFPIRELRPYPQYSYIILTLDGKRIVNLRSQ